MLTSSHSHLWQIVFSSMQDAGLGQLTEKIGTRKKKGDFAFAEEQGKIDIKPVSGEELEKSVLNVLQLEPGLVAKLKDMIKS